MCYGSYCSIVEGNDYLSMNDTPKDPTAASLAACLVGQCYETQFLTELVGILPSPPDEPTFEPLFTWTWESSYTGTPPFGGIQYFRDGANADGSYGNAQINTIDTNIDSLPLDVRQLMISDGAVGVSTSVPEPDTWAVLLIGFAGLRFASYRRSGKRIAALPL
jgi:hypothetical protein